MTATAPQHPKNAGREPGLRELVPAKVLALREVGPVGSSSRRRRTDRPQCTTDLMQKEAP